MSRINGTPKRVIKLRYSLYFMVGSCESKNAIINHTIHLKHSHNCYIRDFFWEKTSMQDE